MKTLGVRVRHQNASALKIARWLEQHDAVARVNYPGLESHSNHLRACELFDGFGGVLSSSCRRPRSGGTFNRSRDDTDQRAEPRRRREPDHAPVDDLAFGNVGG